MKVLILVFLSIISFNSFSATEGEDKGPECKLSTQTNSRDPKIVIAQPQEEVSDPKANTSNLSI